MEMPCPLCESAQRVRTAPNDDWFVACAACGNYRITYEARINLPNELVEEDERFHLSAITRQASDAGSPITLASTSLRSVLQECPRPESPLEQMDLLLIHLARNSKVGEKLLKSAFDHDYPVAFARGWRELYGLYGALARIGWIEHTGHENPDRESFAITVPGWQRLAELKKQTRRSNKAFVAMWYDASLDDAWETGLRAPLHALGYDPIRLDREHHNEPINDFMIARIRESALLVADMTGHRPNVYWEAGFARGLDIPVILTCRDSDIGAAAFDTQQYSHITWSNPADLAKKLRARIEATIVVRPVPRRQSGPEEQRP